MIRKSGIREIQVDRIIFLKKAYEMADGDPNKHISLQAMKKEIGAWGTDLFRTIATYWMDKDCIHGVGKKEKVNLIRLTAQGIDIAEVAMLRDSSTAA